MHTSHALLRKFSWATNVLWPEDIERSGIPSYIVLSEDDQFVSTQDVVRMVPKETRDLIRTDVFCKSEHGGFLFEEEFEQKLIRNILAMMRYDTIREVRKKRRRDIIGFRFVPLQYQNILLEKWQSLSNAKQYSRGRLNNQVVRY